MSFGGGGGSGQEPKTTKVQIVGNETSDTDSGVNRRVQDNQDDGIPQATLLNSDDQSRKKRAKSAESSLLR